MGVGGNFPGGNSPGGQFSGGQFSGEDFSWGAFFPGAILLACLAYHQDETERCMSKSLDVFITIITVSNKGKFCGGL